MMNQNMGMNGQMDQNMMNNMLMNMNMMGMNNQMGQVDMNQMVNMMNNMNNQIQNQASNNSDNTNTDNQGQGNDNSNNDGINVIFRVSGPGQTGAPISIQCMPKDKVSDIIERYKGKSGDKDTTKRFIFNAKELNPSLTIEEVGMSNNANIFVVTTKGVKGA